MRISLDIDIQDYARITIGEDIPSMIQISKGMEGCKYATTDGALAWKDIAKII